MEIRLNELLKEKGLSKNKLSHKAEMNWKQIDNYCTNSQVIIENICEMVEFLKLAPMVRELEKKWAERKLRAMSLW